MAMGLPSLPRVIVAPVTPKVLSLLNEIIYKLTFSSSNTITLTLKTVASVCILFLQTHSIGSREIKEKTQMCRISAKKAEWVSRLDSSPRDEIKWLFSGESNLHPSSLICRREVAAGDPAPVQRPTATCDCTSARLFNSPYFIVRKGAGRMRASRSGDAVGEEQHPHTRTYTHVYTHAQR